MIELYLKIVALVSALGGIVFGAVKIWLSYKRGVSEELRNHSEELIVQKVELHTQGEEIENMKANFQKSFDSLSADITKVGEGVNARVEKIEDKNREDHRLLFESLNGIGNAVSDINGYLRAKNE